MLKFPQLTGTHRIRNCSPLAATVFPLAIHLPAFHLTPHLSHPLHLSHHPRAHPCRRFASDQATRNTMASDEDYMSFLDKTNQDLSDGQALAKRQEAQSKAVFKTTDAGTQVPKVIKEACEDAVYVTDADEPFEEVSLKWDGSGLPDETEFAKLIEHWHAESADISIMDPVEWDSQGQYTQVIEAVREATKGNDVRVYRVVRDETRCEYWVVSREQGRIVGVKALGVES
ncbi:hypothetical protein C2857_004172 [Epichloe festucae Fl1]|uniref:Uncharacterized protein n=1 Tax=Epichloe festucae (strain Fl1) TaxID=877507 RepID=A0A7S9PWP6_EPIFF|nr:hypothetical protein C2857_004172 [Epichloe festucae Fl1]